jgi:hypothetical protein
LLATSAMVYAVRMKVNVRKKCSPRNSIWPLTSLRAIVRKTVGALNR